MVSSFTLDLPYLKENGPIIQIVLKPSDPTVAKLRIEKKDVPLITVRALIDTGASSTAISHKIVERLQLIPRGTVKVFTSNKIQETRNEYDVAIEFDSNAYLRVLRVLEANLQDHSIDCLIGRDILQFAVFTYNGPEKKVTLFF